MKTFDTKGRRDFFGMDDRLNKAAIIRKRKMIGICGDDSAESINFHVGGLVACIVNGLSHSDLERSSYKRDRLTIEIVFRGIFLTHSRAEYTSTPECSSNSAACQAVQIHVLA